MISTAPVRVLIVEDEPDVSMLAGDLLKRELSARVEVAADCASARKSLSAGNFDVVLLDYRLPDGDGLALLGEISQASSPPAVVMVTGHGDERVAASAFKLGASGYVVKDESLSSTLVEAVDRASSWIAQRRGEQALRDSLKRLQDVTENALAWVWEVDTSGKYTYASPSVERILGYHPEEILEKHFFDLLPPEDRNEMKKRALDMLSRNQSFRELESRNVCKDGKVIWLSTSGVPVFDGEGRFLGYRGADTDITRLKQAEELLRRNRENLTGLIDIAAHELRHTATIFKGYAQLLMEQWDELDRETIVDALSSIDEASSRLVRLVVQLLDTSRIERGKLNLSPKDVRSSAPATRALEELRARGCNNEFKVSFAEEDTLLHVDPDMIKEAIAILIDNATKYSPEGSTIEISCEHRAGEVVYFVADRGTGIPERERDRIFERFYQAEGVPHRSAPGLGLGLYIAKSIVDAHGGWIRVDPRDGGGSVFSICIPRLLSKPGSY